MNSKGRRAVGNEDLGFMKSRGLQEFRVRASTSPSDCTVMAGMFNIMGLFSADAIKYLGPIK